MPTGRERLRHRTRQRRSSDSTMPDRFRRGRPGWAPGSRSRRTGAAMSHMTTSAPSRARVTACARPCPRAAPVTNATLPSSAPMSIHLSSPAARIRVDRLSRYRPCRPRRWPNSSPSVSAAWHRRIEHGHEELPGDRGQFFVAVEVDDVAGDGQERRRDAHHHLGNEVGVEICRDVARRVVPGVAERPGTVGRWRASVRRRRPSSRRRGSVRPTMRPPIIGLPRIARSELTKPSTTRSAAVSACWMSMRN